jgi:predicted ThiF/HesA family dinucleotide-utilizing enzyme
MSGEGDSPRSVARAAAAEVNGRRVNEAIERGAQGAGTAVFVCECGNLGCSDTVELAISEYEAVRSGFERFLVVPGHQIEGIEDVIERHGGYLVVAKRDDTAAEMAYATDDRDDR